MLISDAIFVQHNATCDAHTFVQLMVVELYLAHLKLKNLYCSPKGHQMSSNNSMKTKMIRLCGVWMLLESGMTI